MTDLSKAQGQLSYFSSDFERFEEDFYKYSAFNVPLTFIVDDLIRSMVATGKDYFVLNGPNAKDKRDHYFFFTRKLEDKRVLVFSYLGHKTSLD